MVRLTGLWFDVFVLGYPIPDTRYQIPNTQYPIWFDVFVSGYLIPDTRYQIPDTRFNLMFLSQDIRGSDSGLPSSSTQVTQTTSGRKSPGICICICICIKFYSSDPNHLRREITRCSQSNHLIAGNYCNIFYFYRNKKSENHWARVSPCLALTASAKRKWLIVTSPSLSQLCSEDYPLHRWLNGAIWQWQRKNKTSAPPKATKETP